MTTEFKNDFEGKAISQPSRMQERQKAHSVVGNLLRRVRWCALALLLAAGCALDNSEDEHEVAHFQTCRAAVYGGNPDQENMAHDAVVSVRSFTGSCTGTLVAQDLVLFAAHCACPEPIGSEVITAKDCVLKELSVVLPPSEGAQKPGKAGGGGYSDGQTIVRGKVVVHPGFSATSGVVGKGNSNDVAVLKLYRPIKRKVAVPIEISQTAPSIGDEGEIVGFGRSECGSKIRRSGRVMVSMVKADIIETQPLPIGPPVFAGLGDSGGPLLIEGAEGIQELVGVTVYTEYGGERRTGYTNAVSRRDWILAQ